MSNVSRTLICYVFITISFKKFKWASFIFSKIFHRLSKRILQFLNWGVVDRVFPAFSSMSGRRRQKDLSPKKAPVCVFASKKCTRRLFFSKGRPAVLLNIKNEAAANESKINKEAPSKKSVNCYTSHCCTASSLRGIWMLTVHCAFPDLGWRLGMTLSTKC